MRTGVWMGEEARYSWKEGCMRASGGGAQYSTEVTGRNVYVVGEELLGSDCDNKIFYHFICISFHREQWKP